MHPRCTVEKAKTLSHKGSDTGPKGEVLELCPISVSPLIFAAVMARYERPPLLPLFKCLTAGFQAFLSILVSILKHIDADKRIPKYLLFRNLSSSSSLLVLHPFPLLCAIFLLPFFPPFSTPLICPTDFQY